MPLFLISIFAKLSGIGSFIKAHWQVFAIGAALLVLTGTILIYGATREQAGVTKTELRVEKLHTETVREAVNDSKLAQTVSNAVDAKLAAKLAEQTATNDAKLKEISDAIASLPAVAPVTPERAAVLERVRTSSNSLVDSANGTADYTGPASKPDGN